MGSIRTIESIAKLAKTSVTTLSLPASRINIGAQQYITSALTLNTAVTGVGGVDVAVAASSVYTVYTVVSGGQVYLIGSLNSSLPSGFTQARAVGGFSTNSSSQVDRVATQAGDLDVSGAVSSLDASLLPSSQNFIINGGFDFWQRGTNGAATNTMAGAYVSADRWKLYSIIQSVGYIGASLVRDTAPSINSGFAASISITDTRTDAVVLGQYIEAKNCTEILGKKVTLSFKIKRGVNANVAPLTLNIWRLNSSDTAATELYAATGCTLVSSTSIASNISVLDTVYTQYYHTFAVPETAVNGLFIQFKIGNQNTDVANATGTLCSIGEVMLNIGTKPAEFRRAGGTIGGELALCQRYYDASLSAMAFFLQSRGNGGVEITVSSESFINKRIPNPYIKVSGGVAHRADGVTTTITAGSYTYSEAGGYVNVTGGATMGVVPLSTYLTGCVIDAEI